MSEQSNTTRVVITGIGWKTPLGDRIDDVWERLLAGDSGVGPITRFEAGTFSTNFAAESEVPDLSKFFRDPSKHVDALINSCFTLAAAARAWENAGLGDPKTQDVSVEGPASLDRSRLGIYLGSGEGPPDFDNFATINLRSWDAEARAMDMTRWAHEAYERMTAAREIEQEPNQPMSHLAEAFGAEGPCYNCLTACAASTQAIGEASEVIKRGDADIMMAGGSHTMLHPLGITGFIRLTALSSHKENPRGACRPFSIDRDGFVMGEGAGILILESLEHAQRRGATPLAEIVGFGSSADAFRITDIQPDGEGAQASMGQALEQAGIDPLSKDANGRPPVHYVSAHGTGTSENDSIETRGLRAVFKDNAPSIPVSSIKSMMGHLIAAAGAVEAITCVQAIRTGKAPPTINLNSPDPECDLDYIANESRDLNDAGGVEVALSNSFGFGGQNNTLILKRFSA